jgi:hypothetical protein
MFTPPIQPKILLFVLALAVAAGCSPPEPPAKLARQIAGADRAIISDPYGARLVLKGEPLDALVKAVSGVRRDRQEYAAVFSSTIDFYRETNLLAAIHFQDRIFLTENEQFSDATGLLRKLYHELMSDDIARQTWMADLITDLKTHPPLAGLQSWCVETMRHYDDNPSGEDFHKNHDGIEVKAPAIPAWLREAWPRPPRIWIRERSPGRAECVVLNWSSYGLLIGPTNYITSPVSGYTYSTNAPPGIYGFYN